MSRGKVAVPNSSKMVFEGGWFWLFISLNYQHFIKWIKIKSSSIVTPFMEKHPDWVPPPSSFLPYGNAGFGEAGSPNCRGMSTHDKICVKSSSWCYPVSPPDAAVQNETLTSSLLAAVVQVSKNSPKYVLLQNMWVSAHEKLISWSFSKYIFLRETSILKNSFPWVFQTMLVWEERKVERSLKDRNSLVAEVVWWSIREELLVCEQNLEQELEQSNGLFSTILSHWPWSFSLGPFKRAAVTSKCTVLFQGRSKIFCSVSPLGFGTLEVPDITLMHLIFTVIGKFVYYCKCT